MANDILAIMPKILASGLLALREQAVMPRLVNFNWSTETAERGSTIDVPIPAPQVVGDVTPSHASPAPADKTPDTVQIVLNKWKRTDFHLTDKEFGEISPEQSFFPMQASSAIRALANQANADVFALYKDVFGFTGTAGTTPFAIGSGNFPNSPTDAINLRKVLNAQLAPPDNRRAVLDLDAEANALALPAFSNFEQTGDPDVKIEGRIGRKFGLDWYYDQLVPTHTAGTGAGYLVNDALGLAAGTTVIPVDTGTGTILVGDIVTFAGHTQTYVVTVALADAQFTISPGLVVAVANNAEITLKASHVVNLGFHRDAFAFATRPIADLVFKGGNEFMQMTDPQTGISLALEVSRQHHQTVWEFSILYGVKTIRAELAARLAG